MSVKDVKKKSNKEDLFVKGIRYGESRDLSARENGDQKMLY